MQTKIKNKTAQIRKAITLVTGENPSVLRNKKVGRIECGFTRELHYAGHYSDVDIAAIKAQLEMDGVTTRCLYNTRLGGLVYTGDFGCEALFVKFDI